MDIAAASAAEEHARNLDRIAADTGRASDWEAANAAWAAAHAAVRTES